MLSKDKMPEFAIMRNLGSIDAEKLKFLNPLEGDTYVISKGGCGFKEGEMVCWSQYFGWYIKPTFADINKYFGIELTVTSEGDIVWNKINICQL